MAETTRTPVAKLTSAMRIEQVFVISQPQLRTTTRGDFYIAAFLSDATGKLNGRMWQASQDIYAKLPHEGFVMVKGRTELYQENMQLVIEAIRPVDNDQVDFADFLPTTDQNIEEMFGRVVHVLRQIENPHLQRLAKACIEDADLMAKFKKSPAASTLHHAYIGGLLEHTLSVMELGQRILPHYPQLDGDLVLMALFLHDMGKTSELEYDISFKYSDEGGLIGHIVTGIMMIEEKIKQLNAAGGDPFPKLLRDCLLHIIAAHHGQLDFGSPITPRIPEAFAVHYIDNLDSKVNMTLAMIKEDTGKSNWTNYIRALEAPLYKLRTTEKKS